LYEKANPQITIKHLSENLGVVRIDVGVPLSDTHGDLYGSGMYIKGLLLKILHELLEHHHVNSSGHPHPIGATELAKRLGVKVPAVRSAIARLRSKGIPIGNIHGFGFYLKAPK